MRILELEQKYEELVKLKALVAEFLEFVSSDSVVIEEDPAMSDYSEDLWERIWEAAE